MEGNEGAWTGDEDNLTDLLWRQMHAIADALLERQVVLERKNPDPAIREGINLFIVDLIIHWIDRLAQESDAGRRRDLEQTLRALGSESRRSWVDAPDRTDIRMSS